MLKGAHGRLLSADNAPGRILDKAPAHLANCARLGILTRDYGAVDVSLKRRLAARVSMKSWPICRCAGRPSFWTLIEANGPIFLTPFATFFRCGYKWAKLRNPISEIRFRNEDTLKW